MTNPLNHHPGKWRRILVGALIALIVLCLSVESLESHLPGGGMLWIAIGTLVVALRCWAEHHLRVGK